MPSCDRCGQPAEYRLREAGVDRWACSACAQTDLATPFVTGIAAALRRPPRRTGACPHCGTTGEAAIESGMVGCPLCYETLDDRVWREMGIEKGHWSRTNVW